MNDTNAEPLDEPTRALVVFAAAIAQGEVTAMRESAEEAVAAGVRATWGDELLLQSILMVGWPRTLMAAAHWRKAIGVGATGGDDALAQQHSVLEGALEQQPVRLGVDQVYTRPEHPDRVSSGIQGGRLGDRIEAACHAAHDTYPGPGQLYGKLRRDGCTIWSVIAAADHGNAPSSSERDVPPTVEHRRWIGNRPE